jgi:dienelactone hydrolase
MTQVVLFHSALGLRPGVLALAERLRAAGHDVRTPDLFDGATFDNLVDGTRRRDELGIPELIERARVAFSDLEAGIVLMGLSMGTGAAEFLAATRPGVSAAILVHGAFAPVDFGIQAWPGVPVQAHHATGDREVDPGAVAALSNAVRASGASFEVHTYDRGGHLFEDPDFEGYQRESADRMIERVLGFLASLEREVMAAGPPHG